jgi:hypothetical protein
MTRASFPKDLRCPKRKPKKAQKKGGKKKR